MYCLNYENRLRRFVSSLLGCILLQLADPAIGYPADRYIPVALKEGTEINIKVADASGSLLVVWFIDHDEVRPQFESMLKAINASGMSSGGWICWLTTFCRAATKIYAHSGRRCCCGY